jgi:LEA14-like dessication related protein
MPARSASRRRITARRAALAALGLTVGLGGSGCASLGALTGAGFQRPTLAYESWSADGLDLDGVTIHLRYRLDNPNDFSLDMRRLDYRLEVEGQQVAEGELPAGIQLRARGATPLSVPIRLRWRDIPGFVQLLVTRRDVAYRVTGNAGVATPLGTVGLPFEHQDRVALPRPPSVGLEGVRVGRADATALEVDVRLRIENGNAFPLPVGALLYGLRLGERSLVDGGTHPLAAVPPGGSAVVTVPIRISLQGLAETFLELLRGAALSFQGRAGYGPLEVPVETEPASAPGGGAHAAARP